MTVSMAVKMRFDMLILANGKRWPLHHRLPLTLFPVFNSRQDLSLSSPAPWSTTVSWGIVNVLNVFLNNLLQNDDTCVFRILGLKTLLHRADNLYDIINSSLLNHPLRIRSIYCLFASSFVLTIKESQSDLKKVIATTLQDTGFNMLTAELVGRSSK